MNNGPLVVDSSDDWSQQTKIMKAIAFTKYGEPENLELKEAPTPVPKDDELLIRVHASSINSWDWEFLNGKPFMNRLMFGLLRPKRENRDSVQT